MTPSSQQMEPPGIPVRFMTRDNPHTKDEIIRFEYVRELAEADLQERSNMGQAKKSVSHPPVIKVDPVMAAAREHWKPGLSVRALHETLTKKLKLRVSRDRVGKLVKTLQAEGQGAVA